MTILLPRDAPPASNATLLFQSIENRVWKYRWCALLIGGFVIGVLQPVPISVPLISLGGWVIHNAVRLLLLRYSLWSIKLWSRLLFALDCLILPIGVWPILEKGEYPIQIVFFGLQVEAAARASLERPRRAAVGMAVLTLYLVFFEFWGLRAHERWGDILLWSLAFTVLGIGGTYVAQVQWWLRLKRQVRATISVTSPVSLNSDPSQSVGENLDAPTQDTTSLALSPEENAENTTPNPLSKREREVLTLVSRGMTNKEIAKNLHIVEGTVETHLDNIFRKTETRSRTHAAITALERGWIERPPLPPV